uniref:Uncharacterized protein n=1 Tax=Panagrolaimus superbus TaxID=310955 RepID=A0A914YZC4_9BILA
MPRRSRRARSIVNRFSSDNYPLLKVEKDPENPKTVPRIIRSRSLDVYAEDENPANASRQYSNFFYEEMRRNVGQIRIPLVTEVLQMSQYMIKMRNIEIDFIEDVIGKMIEQKVEQELIDIWETALKAYSGKLFLDFKKFANQLEMPDLSRKKYQSVSSGIIRNCESCNPK